MGYYLTIDKGNTATKVALWDGLSLLKFGGKIDSSEELCKFLNDCGKYPCDIEKAIFCSVTQDNSVELNMLKENGIEVIVFNHQLPISIVNAYKTPHTLGLDRLAAAVGAWEKYNGEDKDILVVDLGSAITYDIVTADGRYVGGNIAPGVRMRFGALHNFTSRLPLIEPEGDYGLWGDATETAIRSGVITGIVGEITYYKSQLSDNCDVVLTGGDAAMIAEKLDFSVKVEHELVSTGLNRILLYNENN